MCVRNKARNAQRSKTQLHFFCLRLIWNFGSPTSVNRREQFHTTLKWTCAFFRAVHLHQDRCGTGRAALTKYLPPCWFSFVHICKCDKYAKQTNTNIRKGANTFFSTALRYPVPVGTSVFLTDFPNVSFNDAMRTGSAAIQALFMNSMKRWRTVF